MNNLVLRETTKILVHWLNEENTTRTEELEKARKEQGDLLVDRARRLAGTTLRASSAAKYLSS